MIVGYFVVIYILRHDETPTITSTTTTTKRKNKITKVFIMKIENQKLNVGHNKNYLKNSKLMLRQINFCIRDKKKILDNIIFGY